MTFSFISHVITEPNAPKKQIFRGGSFMQHSYSFFSYLKFTFQVFFIHIYNACGLFKFVILTNSWIIKKYTRKGFFCSPPQKSNNKIFLLDFPSYLLSFISFYSIDFVVRKFLIEDSNWFLLLDFPQNGRICLGKPINQLKNLVNGPLLFYLNFFEWM